MVPGGRELLLDLRGCDRQTLADPERLREFGLALWRAAMPSKVATEPMVVRLTGGGEADGHSLVQLGAGASIVGHFDERTGTAVLNLFSVNGIEAAAAEEMTRDLLGASEVGRRLVDRGLGATEALA